MSADKQDGMYSAKRMAWIVAWQAKHGMVPVPDRPTRLPRGHPPKELAVSVWKPQPPRYGKRKPWVGIGMHS